MKSIAGPISYRRPQNTEKSLSLCVLCDLWLKLLGKEKTMNKNKEQEQSFESSLASLERIVAHLESGDLPLERALELSKKVWRSPAAASRNWGTPNAKSKCF